MPPRKIRRTPEERAMRAIARMSPGTVAGRIESASPVRQRGDSPAPLPGSSAVLIVERNHYHSSHTVQHDTDLYPDWIESTNPSEQHDAILDLTDPQFPTVVAEGIYAVTFRFTCSAPPGGGAEIKVEGFVGDLAGIAGPGDTSPFDGATYNWAKALALSYYCAAGQDLSAVITQNSGADQTVQFDAYVQRLWI